MSEQERQEFEYTSQQKSRSTPISLRAYLLAALMLQPAFQIKSEGNDAFLESQTIVQSDHPTSEGNVEHMISIEAVFKDGIRRALKGLNSISQIPTGGKPIEYYRSEGSVKGKKLMPEAVQALNLPEKFDISPRHITKPVKSMVLSLGNRKFDVDPLIGNIQSISLDAHGLFIGTTLKNITYDKQEKLPDLMFRLWMTPKGKGVKSGFRGSTITEL